MGRITRRITNRPTITPGSNTRAFDFYSVFSNGVRDIVGAESSHATRPKSTEFEKRYVSTNRLVFPNEPLSGALYLDFSQLQCLIV